MDRQLEASPSQNQQLLCIPGEAHHLRVEIWPSDGIKSKHIFLLLVGWGEDPEAPCDDGINGHVCRLTYSFMPRRNDDKSTALPLLFMNRVFSQEDIIKWD